MSLIFCSLINQLEITMTTIARKDNIIACDSRYVLNRGLVGFTTDIDNPKLFIHETRRAVVALSGFCNNPELFKYIKDLIGQMVVDQGTYPESFVIKPEEIHEYLMKQKLDTYNFTVLVAGSNLTTLLSICKEKVNIHYYRPFEMVVIGTGQLAAVTSGNHRGPVEVVQTAMIIDDQSGGKVYWVNLENLERAE